MNETQDLKKRVILLVSIMLDNRKTLKTYLEDKRKIRNWPDITAGLSKIKRLMVERLS